MSRATTEPARVVSVAAGVENTGRTAPVPDGRHQALAVLIGKWINEGRTIETAEIPSVPILTSDVYEWAPGGFFVVHSAFGKIGDTSVGGVETGRPPRVQRRRHELDRLDGRDAAQGGLSRPPRTSSPLACHDEMTDQLQGGDEDVGAIRSAH